jgi:enoyl-CoA hydratase
VIHVESAGRVAVVRMDDGKANAINPDFLDALDASLDRCRDAGAGPIVITGARSIFSAGLDLPRLVDFDRPAMTGLMRKFHEVFARIFLWPRPVVAAVNGHAVAGGCVLAMQADVRVMSEGQGRIGINELALDVGLPAIVIETFRSRLGTAGLWRMAFGAELYDARAAAAAGIVREVVAPENLVDRAVDTAAYLDHGGAPAFAQTKAAMNRPAAAALASARDAEGEAWLDVWFSESAQLRVREAVERLKRKSPPG